LSDLDEREIEKLNRQLEQASQDILKGASGPEDINESEQSRMQAQQMEGEETNYYKENIFNKEDYYLYRAVMYFYAGEYEKSINDLDVSSSIMHA
jgi:tetratricopeptide (TPR) repeat protein